MYRKKTTKNYNSYSYQPKQDAELPKKEEPNMEANLLQQVTFKSLSLAEPVTVYADPDSQGTKSAVPYAIINKTNPVVNGNYGDKSTLAGNSFPQILNNTTTRLLNLFDCITLPIDLNYLYMNIDGQSHNTAVNIEIEKSIAEALSTTYGQMYTQLPFFTRQITSPGTQGVNSNVMPSNGSNYNIFLTWYQTNLQNIALIPGRYNLLMAMKDTLKNMSYNRESNILNDLYGLLAKNSFRAKISSVSDVIKGEYFDMKWREQINTLTMVPCRKTSSMSDPLMTLNPIMKVPSILVKDATGTTTLIDDYTFALNIGTSQNPNYLTLDQAVRQVITWMDPVNVLAWARQYNNNTSVITPTQYFNNLDLYLDYIKIMANRFEVAGEDIRVVLSVATKAGLCNWVQGIKWDVESKMSYEPVYNKIVEDVFKSYFASSGALKFDTTTYRWKYYSMWNKYLGIPKFDQKTGGAFLTISTRGIDTSTDTNFTTSKYLLPVLFDVSSAKVATMYTRLGTAVNITYTEKNAATITQDKVLNRLNPINFQDLVVRIPTIDLTAFSDIPQIASPAYQMLANLFGLGMLEIAQDTYDTCCNSDNICYVDIELDDISNEVIVFAQTRAPFKVYNNKTNLIGFNK